MQTNKVELVEFELTSEDDSEEKTATLPAKTATLPVFTPQVPGDALSGGAEPHKVIEPVRDTIAQISLKLLTTMVGTAQALPLPGLSRATDERLTGKADEPRNVRSTDDFGLFDASKRPCSRSLTKGCSTARLIAASVRKQTQSA